MNTVTDEERKQCNYYEVNMHTNRKS